ncbi:MAG: hypothetical protein IKE24_13250 [Clostridia bacterium]|nr:hypothetical protein [Clostridia bacterium]
MKIRTYPDQWTDRTMTTLRAGRLEACERDLEGLGGSGLFEEGTTDLDAERLFDISWMKGEEKIPRLHTVEEMRAQVLGQFAQEFALLSPEEHDLVLKMSVIGGEFPLYDWNDLIPARSLIRRLWCRLHPERHNWLVLPSAFCLFALATSVSEEAKRVKEIVDETIETVENTLYLAGAMTADTVIRDLAWKLQGSMAADQEHLYRRLLLSAFDTIVDMEGRLILIHPGLADPYGFLKQPERRQLGQDWTAMADIYASLMDVEDPLYDRMLNAITGVTRQEAGAEDTVEDLILLAKQGATLPEMRDVLSRRIICMPTDEMMRALSDIRERTPGWLRLRMNRAQ